MVSPGGCRVGALSVRPLGMGRTLGMVMDRKRTLGILSFSLWPVASYRTCVGLAARSHRATTCVHTRLGGFFRRSGVFHRSKSWPCGMVSFRTGRAIPPLVSPHLRLFAEN